MGFVAQGLTSKANLRRVLKSYVLCLIELGPIGIP